METTRKYHIIKDGKQMEVSSEELHAIQESNESAEFDVQWYLNNGYSLAEDVFRRIESHGDNQ